MENSNTVVVETHQNPGCLLQILWFAFIGIWLGQVWMIVAWLLIITILGIPLGIAMLNKLPKIIALREHSHHILVRKTEGGFIQREVEPPQAPFLLRVVYFILVGWWLSALWMEVAYLICLTVIGLPVGFWMFDRVPQILTLKR